MNVLVTGAAGFVGSNLVKELLNNGYNVTALHRAGSGLDEIKDLKINFKIADIRDKKALIDAFEGIDIVYHIAALFRQAKFPDSVYHDINVKGTENVFEAAIACGVKKVIHCSTVGVHSHISNPPATETEEYRPGDIYQKTKMLGEKLAIDYYKSGKMKGAVIRPAMIWGEGDLRTLKIFKMISKKKFPIIGDGKTNLHWIYVKDLARAFRVLSENDNVNGEVFIISGKETITIEHMVEKIANQYGLNAPKLRIPAFPVQLIGSIVELICIPFRIEPPIYRRRVDFYTKTRHFDSSKARNLLGFEPEFDFEGEVKQIAKWYKENNWL